MKSLRLLFVVTFLTAVVLAPLSPAGATPDVVVSIKPLHSLVAGVMRGIARPHLLIAGAASPHTYSLKPSQARLLGGADAVFWAGPAMETFLIDPLQVLAGGARLVALADAAAIQESISDADPHVWLDPLMSRHMVRQSAAVLAALDPANAAIYARNAETTAARLDALDATLRGLLAPFRGRPYFVLHDAFGHLARRYGLAAATALAAAPGRPAGARGVAALRRAIAKAGPTCLFLEPDAAPALVATLTEGGRVQSAVLDPLGIDVTPGPDAYFTMMENLARVFAACLAAR